jgi:hypothetical protein
MQKEKNSLNIATVIQWTVECLMMGAGILLSVLITLAAGR